MSEGHASIAQQFDDLAQQHWASWLGMWVFLVTEVMFFGALFLGYTAYRATYPEGFAEASRHLNWVLGGINTGVLLCSSLSMALAVHAAQAGARRALVGFLLLTMLLGGAFLGIKAVEYHNEYVEGLVPALRFSYAGASSRTVELFFTLYFIMTGLHALHLTIGIGAVAVIAMLAWRNRFSSAHHSPVELTGLYWHFVDIVWVFLFPLLYLMNIRP